MLAVSRPKIHGSGLGEFGNRGLGDMVEVDPGQNRDGEPQPEAQSHPVTQGLPQLSHVQAS
jgi:hypothetical protein